MRIKNSFIKSSMQGFAIMFRATPKMLIIQCILATLHGFSWVMQVLFIQRFFDSAQGLLQGNFEIEDVIFSMLIMVLSYAFTQVMNGADNYHGTILNLAISKHVNMKIFEKIDELETIEFENESRLNDIEKAISGGENLVWLTLTFVDTLLFYGVYFISMSFFLFTLHPFLSISVLFVFIPCLVSNVVQYKNFEKFEENTAPLRRAHDSYLEFTTDLKETRFIGATNFFKKKYFDTLNTLNTLTFKVQLKKSLMTLLFELLNVLGYGIILFMILVFVMRQQISIGAFVAVLTSIITLFNFMEEVISERLSYAFENVAAVGNFFSFLKEKKLDDKEFNVDFNSSISFENVNFIYPNATTTALENLNFKINRGEIVAIVGENGSGKSTLCRLILGLYKPSDGVIKVDECLLENSSKKQISAVFQRFCKYKMTIKENIIISDFETDVSDEELFSLCNASGIDILDKIHEKKLETMLGREFDGAELSGGQWQRIAIARSLFRKSELIVLDEPTAAIDPLEETRLYEKFVKICAEKTSIIVTHRLGAAKIADRILLLKDGRLIEEGTHEELMRIDGEYKRMFEIQNQWYS